MEITWNWENNSNWDPFTLLGEIELTDEQGNSIKDDCTTIDSWVQPLLEGLNCFKNNKESTIDLVVEPDPLEFIIQNGIKKIQYGNSNLIISNEDLALKGLAELCKKVIKDIRSHEGTINKEALIILEKVACYC